MNVLITGCSNGIGNAILEKFSSLNHFCIGLDMVKLENSKENIVNFVCDITNYDSLSKVENYLNEHNIKLDLIINIAGIHKMASLVETDFNYIKKLIDINLTGTMLVNHTFYKYLTNKGKIIILTSEVASFTPMPFNGLYNISKTALETYADALRQELNLLGNKVITIQPGSIETKLSKNSLTDTKELANNTKLYEKQAKRFYTLVSKFMGKPLKAEKLASLIYKVSLKKHPKLTYKIHRSFGLVLLNILPKRTQLFIIKSLLNKK